MKKYLFFYFLGVFSFINVSAQDTSMIAPADYNRDTLLYRRVGTVLITDKRGTRTPEEEEAYQRLKSKVIKLYPYALLAKKLDETTNIELSNFQSNSEKRKYIKSKEKELRERFENEIKALYVTDGPILVKLIHRETGKTCHEIIRQHKSWFNTSIYQIIAKSYGYSLKDTFDPNVDTDIENIVQLLKSEGQLPVYAD